jgi:hypothetical protein
MRGNIAAESFSAANEGENMLKRAIAMLNIVVATDIVSPTSSRKDIMGQIVREGVSGRK